MRFFDPSDRLLITRRKLPHWAQDGAVVFITWRTQDSMPKHVIEHWRAERNRWLAAHDIDPADKAWKLQLQNLPPDQMLEFHDHFTTLWHDELDACHGSCVLERPEIADMVQNSLLYFNGDRYEMLRFVIAKSRPSPRCFSRQESHACTMRLLEALHQSRNQSSPRCSGTLLAAGRLRPPRPPRTSVSTPV